MEERRRALSWSSAATIALREVHAAKAKFAFVALSVAIGVAALIGVRGFSDSFKSTLLLESRTIMAADLSARMFRPATEQEEQQMDTLASQGLERTSVVEMVSMASTPADPVPLVISLKAVDSAAYPYYGTVQLASGGSLRQVLNDSTVVVADDLLVRLSVRVGDTLKIGEQSFRIADVVEHEPDRLSSGMGLGPRVMMTRAALERTGLLLPGSRSGERLLFRLPATLDVNKARAELERALPDAQIVDFRETNPALSTGLTRATGVLSLICLVAMVLGAIGVGMAMRAHLQQRIEILAIMKSIGARSSDILRIYLFQTLLLGLAGGLLGVAFGLGVEWVFPAVLGKLLPLRPPLRLPLRAAAEGLGTGVLTTLLFCLPPLLDVRTIRPILVLRRGLDTEGGGWWARLKNAPAQVLSAIVILGGLGGIAAGLSESGKVGGSFAVALCVLLLVCLGLSALLLRVLRAFLSRTRLHLPPSVRHALANLYRPGNQSAAVLSALGMGVMLILSVFLVQSDILRAIHTDAPPETPNVFLIDMSTRELPGIEKLLAQQPGVRGGLEKLPVIPGRILQIDGVASDQLKLKNYPRRLLAAVSLTWSDGAPAGCRLVQGKWPQPGEGTSLAVMQRTAERLQLHVGSQVVFQAGGRTIEETVTAIFKSDGQHVYGRSEFILSPIALQGLPVVWYGAVHIDPPRVGDTQRVLFASYPTVTVINIADVVETAQSIVSQITIVVRFLAAFSVLSGVVILASSVASTRFRRIREVVVLKTLGARRAYIARVFSFEFLVLGLLAGIVGAVFANLLTRVVLHWLEADFHFRWTAAVAATFGAAALAIATGWVASARILGQKPLEVLREE